MRLFAYKRIGLENDVVRGVRVRLTQVHVQIVVFVGAISCVARTRVNVGAVGANKGGSLVAQWSAYSYAPDVLGCPLSIAPNRSCYTSK